MVFGKAARYTGEIDLSTVGGATPGFKFLGASGADGAGIPGEPAADRAGYSVQRAGDVNGDGFGDLLVSAPAYDANSDPAVYQLTGGRTYLIYGKQTFGATLDLATITSADGVKIDGINTAPPPIDFDFAGSAVSAAGDINGDGFDDLIIGAMAGDGGGLNAGEAHVIYGGNFRFESTAPKSVTGAAAAETIMGGIGSDTLLDGNGGADVVRAGAGDDLINFRNSERLIDGGNGKDTLSLAVGLPALDLSALVTQLASIEKIDLRGNATTALTLTSKDVLDLAGAIPLPNQWNPAGTAHQLLVRGDGGATDSVTSTGQGWVNAGVVDVAGVNYNSYTDGLANLLVETTLTQNIT